MRKVAFLLSFVLLFMACNTIVNNVEDPKKLVQPKLGISSQHITPKNDIKVTYKLKNYSGEKVTYGFSSGCQTAYIIKKDDEIIYNQKNKVLCTGALTHFHIKSFETKKIDFTIYWSQFDEPLAKGIYTLEMFLRDKNGERTSTQFVVE